MSSPDILRDRSERSFTGTAKSGLKLTRIGIMELIERRKFDREFAEVKELLSDGRLNHGLLVPDGDRRFADKMGMHPSFGHERGAEKAFELLDMLMDLNIKWVTAWGLSKKNMSRPPDQLARLLEIEGAQIEKLEPYLERKNARFHHEGDREGLPKELLDQIDSATELTRNNTGTVVTALINYGANFEHMKIERIAGRIAHERGVPSDQVGEDIIEEAKLERAKVLPPVQFVFRSGEDENGLVHLSDLGPLIEGAYIYAVPELFPEVRHLQIVQGLKAYANAKIREGK